MSNKFSSNDFLLPEEARKTKRTHRLLDYLEIERSYTKLISGPRELRSCNSAVRRAAKIIKCAAPIPHQVDLAEPAVRLDRLDFQVFKTPIPERRIFLPIEVGKSIPRRHIKSTWQGRPDPP